MPKIMSARKGFTLVELLVAISIVTIIAAIGYVTYTNAQVAARDARRKQDLRSIKLALELYYQQNKHYPCANTNNDWKKSTIAYNDAWITDSTDPGDPLCGTPSPAAMDNKYISPMPDDPLSNGGQPTIAGQYGYAYWAGNNSGRAGGPTFGTLANCKNGQVYILITQLENPADPDRTEVAPATLCNGQKANQTTPSYSNTSFVLTNN